MLSKLAITVLVAAALSVALIAPVDAGRGGRGNGNGNGGHTQATLTVSPEPVPAGTTFTIAGTGLKANKSALVGVVGRLPWDMVTTDSSGSFSLVYDRALEPGTYTVRVLQEKGRDWVIKASAEFTVTA